MNIAAMHARLFIDTPASSAMEESRNRRQLLQQVTDFLRRELD